MNTYFDNALLLSALPIRRAAYSDRTAWLMAEISRLIYEPLPGETTVAEYVEELRKAIREGKHEDLLEGLVSKCYELNGKDCQLVERELRNANFELLGTFVQNDTEALLAKLSQGGTDSFLVLAFRGTASIRDVATDMQIMLVPAPGGGRVHKGFLNAFQSVEKEIRDTLAKHPDLPLYITGHSLGGALAIVATRYLGSDSTGATYTFGAPRAADDDFFIPIKTPIYRVVNAADAVPRVPFGYGLNIALAAIRLFPIKGFEMSEWLRRFSGYTHEGSLIFMDAPQNLTDDKGIPFKDLKVKKSPNYAWRSYVVLQRILTTSGKAAAADHSIDEYCQKLQAHALRRL
ncbi:lipase family protein [Desulfovibrio mangrovi]|uniref:lipase family protein n=1 Tax=Desulfovibrio mangrovi TaxID=2976983 RepID=UPI0022457DD2|nr:lipase family protein [Desulfovibrio mangrovi]UZP68005.1 lipase family protein [Desulfovibrio mangrovi]